MILAGSESWFVTQISVGNIITTMGFLVTAVAAWKAYVAAQRDLDWRISNLETWRKEHLVDAHARDDLIRKLDRIISILAAGGKPPSDWGS